MNRVLRALLRSDFASFIPRAFGAVNPGTPYLHNWHIEAIAEHLQAASERKLTRLIINMPPRSLKSLCVSVAWPAWLLGNAPERRIIAASYSQGLSVKHSIDSRLVVSSPWFREAFPGFSIASDQNEKSKFMTTRRGFRFATSVGGTLTGEGGDFLILDDPMNPAQGMSALAREEAVSWFEQTFSTRLDDKKKGVIVLVMQRLHERDLAGHLLEKNGWERLVLPAIAERRLVISLPSGREIVREEGSFLHCEREGAEEIKRAREEMGAAAFAAQYQQNPSPESKGMIKREWLKYYGAKPEGGFIAQSWDTAIKSKSASDYTAGVTILTVESGYHVLDVVREKVEYPEMRRLVLAQAEKWRPEAILIEDKASGQSLLQELRRETALPVIPCRPKEDKITRLAAVSPLIEAGKLLLSSGASWLGEFEAELLSFPAGSHDDMVDALSQALAYFKEKRPAAMRMRRV